MYQREALGYTYQRVAENLNVDTSTVWRTVQLFLNTGGVSKKEYSKDNLPRKMNESILFVILQVVLDHPGVYLREIQAHIEYVTGTRIAASTICKALHDQRFSRKRMQLVARQRDESLRAAYAAEMSLCDPEMFVFLDETGSDRRNALRRCGYSWRGKPAISHKLLVRGERISSIACISMKGVLECTMVTGSVDGDTYNPIEEAFSKVKTLIKAYEEEMEMNHMDMVDIVLTAFSHITKQDCQEWIHHCGIYNTN